LDLIGLGVRNLDRKLLEYKSMRRLYYGMGKLRTSSIAITTSTVSKLSSPRSVVKEAEGVN
jgi:hypothetical protein